MILSCTFPFVSLARRSKRVLKKRMDTITSDERRLGENMILKGLLRDGGITVKEEPLITSTLVPVLDINVKREPGPVTPSPSPFIQTEVIDLVDDDTDDDDDDEHHVQDGMDTTSTPLRVTDFLTIDLEVDSPAAPASDTIEGNGEAQHSTMKQLAVPNSVTCRGSVHPSMRPVETNSGSSVDEQPECHEPVRTYSHSNPSQRNSESNSVQEPQCLGPFVESSSIKCPKCSVVLTQYYQILYHPCIEKHISSEAKKKRIKCCFCENEYGTVRSLQKHIKTYVTKTFVKCSVCGTRLSSITSFKAHALTHTNQWPYRCSICGQGSASEYHLELHKTIHTNEKPWMCDVCGAMFPNEARLNGHRIVHLEKKYECDLCFAKFRERHRVKDHKKRVHNVKKKEFQCEKCSSSFTSKYTLKMHIEIKHDASSGGESVICSMCNKEFKHRQAFKRHVYKHKSKNENIMYTCDMCKRNFVTKTSLTRHILEHNGKQFSCNLCGMSFTQPSSVKRHMLKIHPSDI